MTTTAVDTNTFLDVLAAKPLADAGRTSRAYRDAKGPRSRILSDFLIGAHARAKADRFLTRDRGFFRHWFEDLEILDPSRTHEASDKGAESSEEP